MLNLINKYDPQRYHTENVVVHGTNFAKRVKYFVIILCLMIGISASNSVYAQPIQSGVINREHDIKAAYIYNFCKYIQWPNNNKLQGSNSEDFVIGVLGNSPVTTSLKKVAKKKKTIRERRLVVEQWSSEDDFRRCHVIFVSRNSPSKLVKSFLVSKLNDSVLLVGEQQGFASDSGVINFFIDQNKIRFEINARTAELNQLKISAKLMQLGRIAKQ